MKRILTAMAVALALCALAAPAPAQSGKQKEDLTVRSVEGVVTGADGNPAPGAVVYLTNTKTQQIRTYNSGEQGQYVFHGLSADIDYQLKAQRQGASSVVRNLSAFDSRRKAVIDLKLKK